jgi:hypothetical protein
MRTNTTSGGEGAGQTVLAATREIQRIEPRMFILIVSYEAFDPTGQCETSIFRSSFSPLNRSTEPHGHTF